MAITLNEVQSISNMPQIVELLKPGVKGFHPDLDVFYQSSTDTIRLNYKDKRYADLFTRKEIQDIDWKSEFTPRVLKFLNDCGTEPNRATWEFSN